MKTELIFAGRTDIAHTHLKLIDAPTVNGKGRLWRPDQLALEWTRGELTLAVLKGSMLRHGELDIRARGQARWLLRTVRGDLRYTAAAGNWEPHEMPKWLYDLIGEQEVPSWGRDA
jgi:hypothetical protein